MDYEKAYKQLVEDFGAILNLNTVKESGVISVEDVRKLIPELAESEDERIRKELISFFKDRKSRLDRLEDKFAPSNFPCDDYSLCEKAISWFEKQSEQKPANKVKPKFKVGDWVVFNNTHNSIYQVEKIENYQYTIRHILGGSMPLSYSSENMLRRWTIQDAKDGDVLVYRDEQWVFLYKDRLDDTTFSYYALVSEIGLMIDDAAYTALPKSITPATKEQRDTLTKAMADAGYTFDFEKKELKKIEQKSIEEYNIISLKDFQEAFEMKARQYDIELPNRAYDIHAMCEELYSLLIKQKPANTDFSDLRTWKYIVDAALTEKEGIGQYLDSPFTEEVAKKLQKRFGNIEQKLVSSDCDRAFKDFVKRWNEEGSDPHIKDVESTFSEKIMALIKENKALKDRYAWKPSEEQIKTCKEVYADILSAKGFDLGTVNSELNRLEEQLKKLREE